MLYSYKESYASDTSIVFRNIMYSEIFDMAKNEKKKVMLYFNFDGCSACEEMKINVFTNQIVRDYYNSEFVCFSINILKGEGVDLRKYYDIQICPTFLFLTQNGERIHKIVGEYDKDDFINEGKKAKDNVHTLSVYKKKHKEGENGIDFLREYCYTLNNAMELDSFYINKYISAISEKDLKKPENVKFIYQFALHNNEPAMPFSSREFTFMLNNRKLFSTFFDRDQVDVRLIFIILAEVENATKSKDIRKAESAINILKLLDKGKIYTYRRMDGSVIGLTNSKHLVLTSWLYFYEETGDEKRYDSTMKEMIKAAWDDSKELNTLTWNYVEKYTDEKSIRMALKWIERSVALKSKYSNNDTWATLLFKLGNKKEALVRAQKAIEIAKKENIDYTSTSNLIKEIYMLK